MSTVDEIPEEVLHNVIAAAIESTRFRGWQFSLRLVNHRFNEAVIHVYYIQKRLQASTSGHTLDCLQPCYYEFCRKRPSSPFREIYAARFVLQSWLATRGFPGDPNHTRRLLPQLEEALAALRRVEDIQNLDSDQVSLYSTCSRNPIFNDPSSAILSEAIRVYLGPEGLTKPGRSKWIVDLPLGYQAHPSAFWVALCACVLGDLELLDTCVTDLTSIVGKDPSPQGLADVSLAKWLTALLKAAIQYAKPKLVSQILNQHPSMRAKVRFSYRILRAAIFSKDEEVLKIILEHTPNSPNLLCDALSRYITLLPRSASSSRIIRVLTTHFHPLSAKARMWLINHSCSVGDVTLLEEFADTAPLFNDRTFDAGGIIPAAIHFAICGNVESLRFSLEHGVTKGKYGQLRGRQVKHAVKLALSRNQIECFRELYLHCRELEWAPYFPFLGSATNAEEFMADLIRKDKILIFRAYGDERESQPTLAQKALWNSMQGLRPGNVRFLLNERVRIFPWREDRLQSEDAFEIPWPYFTQNRDAFIETQAALDAFGMPKLRVLV